MVALESREGSQELFLQCTWKPLLSNSCWWSPQHKGLVPPVVCVSQSWLQLPVLPLSPCWRVTAPLLWTCIVLPHSGSRLHQTSVTLHQLSSHLTCRAHLGGSSSLHSHRLSPFTCRHQIPYGSRFSWGSLQKMKSFVEEETPKWSVLRHSR